ncbi:MAG: hypothetical protein Q9191_004756 [Dirinaria sp. TL-2023a]
MDRDMEMDMGEEEEEEGEDEWRFAIVLDGHESEVKSVAWSAGGNLLATCSRDKSVWIWEEIGEDDYETVAVLQEHEGDVKCVAWHPEEALLASASYDDEIRLWREDVDDWGCVAVLRGHDSTVWAVEWEGVIRAAVDDDDDDDEVSGNKKSVPRLASCSDDLTIRIWRRVMKERGAPQQSRLSIIRSGNMEEEWVEDCRLPQVHVRAIYSIAWSRKTGRIVSVGGDGKVVVYGQDEGGWSVLAQVHDAHDVSEINHVCWAHLSPDEEIIVSTGEDGAVRTWSTDEMPSRKKNRDKKATHTFFKQDPDDESDQRSRSGCKNSREFYAAADEFDKVTRNLKKVLAKEAKRLEKNAFDHGMPDHWGLSYLENWEEFAEAELAQSLDDFQSYMDKNCVLQALLQGECPDVSIINIPEELSKVFSLILDVEHLSNVINRCCSSAILFNTEMKFGFPEQVIQDAIGPEEEDSEGRGLEFNTEPDISLRQRFNAPVKVMGIKDKPKKGARPRKSLPALTALAETTRQCKWLSKDVQTLTNSISDDYSHCLQLPKTLCAYGQDIPEDIPQHIRQSLWDVAFLREEMFSLHPPLVEQRDQIRSTLLIWIGSGEEVWKWGVEQIHTLPDFQKYEYMQLDMKAMYQLTFRQDEKVIEFFLSRQKHCPLGSDKSTASIEAFLQVGKLTKDERRVRFDQRFRKLCASLQPVDLMVESVRNYKFGVEAEVKGTIGGDWWKDLANVLPEDIIKALPQQHKHS